MFITFISKDHLSIRYLCNLYIIMIRLYFIAIENDEKRFIRY